VSLDLNQIIKMEICCIDDICVEVRVYSAPYAKARIFVFPNKTSAIDFCHKMRRYRSPRA
jgi:hypothetical protein